MRRAPLCALLMGGVLWGAGEARAEERPSEADMFGGGKAGEATATPSGGFGTDSPPRQPPSASRTPVATTKTDIPASSPKSSGDARDELMLGTPGAGPKLSDEVAPEDPLKIGGQIYFRGQVSAQQGQKPGDYFLSSPSLLDVYMDVRPNDRVRGFVLGRMSFDPTLPQTADTKVGLSDRGTQGGFSNGGLANLSSLFGTQGTRTPRVALDQMWMRFDLKRRVFVTAGRQHVRWGTARFWTPTDYLHMQKRNPVDVFDARTGTSMVKLHIPWEDMGWNFYAYGITENADATSKASKVAGAARAEIVLGTAELGTGVFARRGQHPKYAADLSVGIWDLDLYGEVAVRWAQDVDRIRYDRKVAPEDLTFGPTPTSNDLNALTQFLGPAVEQLYPTVPGSGPKVQATGGMSYSIKYADKDVFTLGAEYFYNSLGYNDTAVYAGLILPRVDPLNDPASFFYLGRHYAGVYALLPSPGSWDRTSFTLSSMANLSDRSGITRLDYSFILLTHLRFEAFGAYHWGEKKGEFRFGSDPSIFTPGQPGRSPALFDVGVGLRMAI